MPTGSCDVAECHRFVQDADRVNLVPEVFQRQEDFANGFRQIIVLRCD